MTETENTRYGIRRSILPGHISSELLTLLHWHKYVVLLWIYLFYLKLQLISSDQRARNIVVEDTARRCGQMCKWGTSSTLSNSNPASPANREIRKEVALPLFPIPLIAAQSDAGIGWHKQKWVYSSPHPPLGWICQSCSLVLRPVGRQCVWLML